ncbi:MAG: site-2 protease family protein [Roseofilum sp. Belize BBD 4]|nr:MULTISPECIES: site-2 protease family protein [unclassified Roseofilum]MBP0009555.1 site-2 protease family protein [Roseofilum sp. Belize Diploria]MBP0032713.1 site-2 protease family protein [Roseofilum sp. Belize BBD 4]HBQ98235.1 hypothetical protein [Cyanobacteria bacterium UBA11691]
MNGNIRVGSLFGIPFYIHPSWFLIVGLVTFNYAATLSYAFPQLGVALPWILGLGVAFLLFSSVLAHELGHSLVAMRQGMGVKSITLFLFGGLATFEKEAKTPSAAFWVAIAGPGVNLILFGLFTVIVLLTAIASIAVPLSAPLALIFGFLAYINLVLGLFNLIPGLPLDGGHILKAVVWKITGKPKRGAVFASRMGQIIGGFGVAIGMLSLLNVPLVVFGIPISGSIWTLIMGWLMLQNASRSTLSPNETAQELLDYQKKIYSQHHEFVRVDAGDFSHLDLKFYKQTQRQLERLGFEKLADMEDLTISKANRSQPHVLIRVMLSRDRRTVAGIFHFPLPLLVKALQAIGLAPKGGKTVDLESEFEDGTFLTTSNTKGFDNSSPFPKIERQQLPGTASISELVRAHRIRVRDLNPHTPALIIRNFDQAIAMQHRLESLKNSHKEAQGYLTREDIQRQAKKGQEAAAEALGNALEDLKTRQSQE